MVAALFAATGAITITVTLLVGSSHGRAMNLRLGATRKPTVADADHVSITSNLVTYTKPFRVRDGPSSRPFDNQTNRPLGELDPLEFTCHGGLLDVTWTVGDLEPSSGPDIGIHIAVYLDGKKLSSMLAGGGTGIFNDRPAQIETVVPRCSAGKHHLAARVDSMTGAFGIPYANTSDRVERGFVVREVY